MKLRDGEHARQLSQSEPNPNEKTDIEIYGVPATRDREAKVRFFTTVDQQALEVPVDAAREVANAMREWLTETEDEMLDLELAGKTFTLTRAHAVKLVDTLDAGILTLDPTLVKH